MPASPACPSRQQEVYIAGTQPVGACPLHGGRMVTAATGWDTAPAAAPAPAEPAPASHADSLPRITGSGGDGQVTPAAVARRAARQSPPDTAQAAKQPPETPAKKEEKPNIFRRLLNVLK
jgi:hypothetical protein